MMETFAEAWVAANTQTPLTEAAAAAADHVSCVVVVVSLPNSKRMPLVCHFEHCPITLITSHPLSETKGED